MDAGRLADGGVYYVDVELGMPLTGRNHLAETPLLKLVGDIRWRHFAELSGVRTKDIRDETGNRLYATFFYVEVNFPEKTPMAAFGENDRFTIVNTLQSFESSMLDGYHFLYPESRSVEARPLRSAQEAIEQGIPYIRTSNAFVRMFQGAGWLKKSKPVHSGMNRIPQLTRKPETYSLILNVTDRGYFEKPSEAYLPLTTGKVRMEYQPQPDRDLNGAGLLYFANYPMVADLAERTILPQLETLPISHELLDLRTVVRRRSAYLSNIQPDDTIVAFLQAWIRAPLGARNGGKTPIRLLLNYELYRKSDQRIMLISTAEKVIVGTTVEEAGLMDRLEDIARQNTAPDASISRP